MKHNIDKILTIDEACDIILEYFKKNINSYPLETDLLEKTGWHWQEANMDMLKAAFKYLLNSNIIGYYNDSKQNIMLMPEGWKVLQNGGWLKHKNKNKYGRYFQVGIIISSLSLLWSTLTYFNIKPTCNKPKKNEIDSAIQSKETPKQTLDTPYINKSSHPLDSTRKK